MRGAARLLYPCLFAASLVLGTAARGAGQFRSTDLALVTAVAMLVTALVIALVLAVTRLFVRTDRAAPLAAALSMVIVAWFFFYVPVQGAAENITWRGSRDVILLPLGALATVGLLAWLVRQSGDRLTAINGFMARFGVLLLAVVAVRVASAESTPAAARRSAVVQQLSQPLRTSNAQAAARNTPRRDIYLIVLDGHANARIVREVLGFDNSQFEDSLRALGFTIPRDMHSNYAQTILSLPSLLNAAHLTPLAQDAGVDNPSYALPKYLIENSRSARFLKSQGYRYVLFPSAWWTPTQHSPLADVEFNARPDFRLGNELRRTELRKAVVNSTLLRYRKDDTIDTLFDIRSMAGLRAMAADTAPTFVLAHFLLPHPPYYLDASCRPIPEPIPPEAAADTPEQRSARLEQLKCADRMVLDVVTTLLRDSPTPPVILIVGDHGSRFADPKFMDHPERLSTAFIRERFGAFGAFHLPAGGDSAVTGSVTLVNVMGHVLRHYFGVDLPPSSSDMYVSGTLPFRLYRVDSTGYLKPDGTATASAPTSPR